MLGVNQRDIDLTDRHELIHHGAIAGVAGLLDDDRIYALVWDGDHFRQVDRTFWSLAGARRWVRRRVGGGTWQRAAPPWL